MAEHLILLRHDTTLLFIDFPGFGDSPVCPQWDFPSFSLELRSTIERYTRKPVILGGLSMGGYAALEFFRQNPDIVCGIVLSNTRAESDSAREQTNRAEFANDALAHGSSAALDRLYTNFVTPSTSAQVATNIRRWILEASPVAIVAALKAMAGRNDSRAMLKNIIVPTLVIASENDRVTRTTSLRKLGSSLPNASFIEIQGAAHLSSVEKPKEWAEALADFLELV